ncbi:MAG: dUTP diphosphatase [Ruminococcus sp.]|nr:dUTP diphosphatase [Ruminococcus sp.]
MKLKFKKLDEKAIIPSRATAGSAGLDIYACLDEPIILAAGEIKMIPTGLAAQTDCDDMAMLIYPRSGLSSKYGVSLANCVGVVDSDYRGEWLIPLINHGKEPFTVENGMRIAQLVLTKIFFPEIEISDSLTETERGTGGFGSTGILSRGDD